MGSDLRDNDDYRKMYIIPSDQVTMHLPLRVGDYTDFFVGVYHARNVSFVPIRMYSSLADTSF